MILVWVVVAVVGINLGVVLGDGVFWLINRLEERVRRLLRKL